VRRRDAGLTTAARRAVIGLLRSEDVDPSDRGGREGDEPLLGDPSEFIAVWVEGQLAAALVILAVAGLLLSVLGRLG